MKFYADKQRTERSFQVAVGVLVYLRIKPYKQVSLQQLKYCKLSPKYFGPYKVLEKIGTMAYRLELPPTAKIHSVFHVSVLKKKIGDKCHFSPTLPPLDGHGQFIVEPLAILDRKLIKKNNVAAVQLLVQWSNTWPSEEEAFSYFPTLSSMIVKSTNSLESSTILEPYK